MEYIKLNKAGEEKLGLKRIVLTRVIPRPHKHMYIITLVLGALGGSEIVNGSVSNFLNL